MNWKLPNQLTVGRIVLAAGFFVLLGMFEQGTENARLILTLAIGLYIVAGITDVLDGYLARRMKLVSAFGRIVDPFVDKVLVVGAFVMLAGSNFILQPVNSQSGCQMEQELPFWLTGGMASAMQAWMVVTILAREFVVSAVRGYSESCGVKFPATSAGKIKMFVQSVTICIILYQLAYMPTTPWAVWAKIICAWATVIVTVLSGLIYLKRVRKLLVSDE